MLVVPFRPPPNAEIVVSRCSIGHHGRRRTYTLVRAEHARRDAALVVVLHGTLQTGDSIREFSAGRFDAYAEGGRVVVVYPDAVRREWNGARKAVMLSRSAKKVDDVDFLRCLVDDIAQRCSIDRHRVFCVGFSLGGQMAIRLVHDAPELLAGAALIASNQPAASNLVCADRPAAPIPVLSIHGTADPLAPYKGGRVSFRGMFPKGPHLSAEATARYYAARNGIDGEPTVEWLVGGQGVCERIGRTEYRRPGHPPVVLYTVVGGGHQIPGASAGSALLFGRQTHGIAAAQVIDEFFGLTRRHESP